ncbi:MAG: glucose PTS transporter subunit IIA [Fusobacteriaceae bacterium]|jgi:PTS system glucose-specific IIA component|nr:glucose PTS transporter subunit IIA [Fusobacteriaceae bacterium]
MFFYNFLFEENGKDTDIEGKKFLDIFSPLDGKIVDLSEVPEDIFSQRIMGDGCAIDPVSNIISSPVNGKFNVFCTGHAVNFDINGLELLIHIGIDSIKLKGEGFRIISKNGTIEVGQPIIQCDFSFLSKKIKSILTPVVINTMNMIESIEIPSMGKNIKIGDLLMRAYLK